MTKFLYASFIAVREDVYTIFNDDMITVINDGTTMVKLSLEHFDNMTVDPVPAGELREFAAANPHAKSLEYARYCVWANNEPDPEVKSFVIITR